MKDEKGGSLLQILKNIYPCYSADRLYAFVLCGNVFVDDECIRDPQKTVKENSKIDIRQKKYVSRGGYKLEKALEVWEINCRDKIVLDAGSSTGGFTDCLLQNGASYVYAVDVGYNQLAYSLRTNDQVNVMERCNIMEVSGLDPKPHFAVSDLSFRSLKGAASHICSLTGEKILIALVKPQFEYAGDEDFHGILYSRDKIAAVLEHVNEYLEEENCFVHGALESPIKGTKGNTEFLFYIRENEKSAFSVKSFVEKWSKETV